MAPLPDKDTSGLNSHDPLHPLTAFTRFIDEQISNVLQSTIGLPSSKEDVQTWQWWKDLENGNHRSQTFGPPQEQRKSQQSTPDWVPSSSDPPNFSQQPQAISSALSELSQALHQLHLVPLPTSIEEMGLIKEIAPSVDILHQNKKAFQELEEYIDRSPYSPTKLEKDQELKDCTLLWRTAFVDLIYEGSGLSCEAPHDFNREWLEKPELEASSWTRHFLKDFRKQDFEFRKQLESSRPIAATVSSILDMFAKSAQKGISQVHSYIDGEIPNNAKNHADSNTNQPVKENRWTEQDFQDMSDQLKKDSEMEQGKPTVTERMTRVKEVTLPDGTVKRTRVLRTSFSDGTSNTETTKEVVSPAKPVESRTFTETTTAVSTIKETKESPEVKKGGWFWR